MMVNNLPEWRNAGVVPPQSLKVAGWSPQDRPPAEYFNWFMNRTYLALAAHNEHVLSEKNPHQVTKEQIGLSNVPNVLPAAKTDFDNHAGNVGHVYYGNATGLNTITISIPAITTLVAGRSLRFKNATTNTAAVTLNVNGLGAKSLLRSNGTRVLVGGLKAGGVYTVCYDGSNFFLQGEGGEYGTARSTDVLEGVTIGTDEGIVEGEVPMIPRFTRFLEAGTKFTIPYGFHDGSSSIGAATLATQTPATVEAKHVLAGRTAWVNGSRITGTMPDYSRAALVQNYVEPVGIIVDAAGTLVVEPKTGYYESGKNMYGFGTIRKEEPNLIPANIVAGKRIFNVVGTANIGKRFATGYGWTAIGGGTLAVTGLAFKPSIVITKMSTNAGQLFGSIHALQTAFPDGASGKLDALINGSLAFEGEFFSYSNGFTVRATNTGQIPIHWIAFE